MDNREYELAVWLGTEGATQLDCVTSSSREKKAFILGKLRQNFFYNNTWPVFVCKRTKVMHKEVSFMLLKETTFHVIVVRRLEQVDQKRKLDGWMMLTFAYTQVNLYTFYVVKQLFRIYGIVKGGTIALLCFRHLFLSCY